MTVNNLDSQLFFLPLYTWQLKSWKHLTARHERLAHGLLISGMSGIGKRAFTWHFVAWMLCHNRVQSLEAACGKCQSCEWLRAGTHPDLIVLPPSSLPSKNDLNDDAKVAKTKKSVKNSSKVTHASTSSRIKIDDIRALQPFLNQSSQGIRICVVDNAETMTVSAANALLKTLEEPRAGVYLLLITDHPSKLLPTIKSRIQQVDLSIKEEDNIKEFILNTINSEESQNKLPITNDVAVNQQIDQAIQLANGAPLAAVSILQSKWYACRKTWLDTWLVLRDGKRSCIAASEFWQKTLDFDEFIILTEFMLMDLIRLSLGFDSIQKDMNMDELKAVELIKTNALYSFQQKINDIKLSIHQNVQEARGYDRICKELTVI